MDIQSEKIELARLLLATDDRRILQKIGNLLRGESSYADWWNEISEEERAAIEQGIREADNGNTVSHTEAVKRFGKWGLK